MQLSNQQGVSLLETMLALTIGVSIVLLGIKFYTQFQFQSNEQKIAAAVDQLFLGLEGFYYANCRQALDVNSLPQSSGSLDPDVVDTSSAPAGLKQNVYLSIMGDLVDSQFIPAVNWRPNNPLVDNSPTPDKGYYVQFNRVVDSATTADPAMSASACVQYAAPASAPSSPPYSCAETGDATQGAPLVDTATTPTAQSRVVVWVAQVAVKLSPSLTAEQWEQIQYDLNATCMSSPSGSGVTPCTASPAGNGYLVWIRTPSYYNKNITSDYWTTTPYVKQFNMQYTNDGMAALAGVPDETKTTSTGKTWYNPRNYLCGG